MTRVDIPVDDCRIERVAFVDSIDLLIGRHPELLIQSPFMLTTPTDGEVKIDPAHPGDAALAVFSLLHRDVSRLEYDTESLTMDIVGGYRIVVSATPPHDAWAFNR